MLESAGLQGVPGSHLYATSPADHKSELARGGGSALDAAGAGQLAVPLIIDVVPIEDGTAANHKCDICECGTGSSYFEVGRDARTVLLCTACLGLLRGKGMAGLHRRAQQSRSTAVGVLPTGPVGVRILERDR